MNDGREHDASDGDDRKPAVDGIETLEQLACRAALVLKRTHAAQQHGGVEKCIDPGEVFDRVIPEHAGEERDDDSPEAEGRARGEAPEEYVARRESLGPMFEHALTSQERDHGDRADQSR
jgi:hypothetical protein